MKDYKKKKRVLKPFVIQKVLRKEGDKFTNYLNECNLTDNLDLSNVPMSGFFSINPNQGLTNINFK